MYGFDHGVWMFGGWLVMLAIWLVPFLALFVGMKYLLGRSSPPAAGKSALDILGEAYARREISREEYLQKRDDLQNK
jgi:putative membrane protein